MVPELQSTFLMDLNTFKIVYYLQHLVQYTLILVTVWRHSGGMESRRYSELSDIAAERHGVFSLRDTRELNLVRYWPFLPTNTDRGAVPVSDALDRGRITPRDDGGGVSSSLVLLG